MLKNNLIASLNARKASLFTSDSALAAAFLDPRTRRDLNTEQQLRSKIHILKLWRRISAFNAQIQATASSRIGSNKSF